MQIILQFINKCVHDVFSTMVGLTPAPGAGEENVARPSTHSGLTGQISLTGKFNGVVYASFTEGLARGVAEKIMGGGGLSDGEINDVVGELTNMISGNLKSQMCDRGFNCQLSIPTIIRGESILIDAKDAPQTVRNTYNFSELGESLTVQVFARLDQ